MGTECELCKGTLVQACLDCWDMGMTCPDKHPVPGGRPCPECVPRQPLSQRNAEGEPALYSGSVSIKAPRIRWSGQAGRVGRGRDERG